MKIRSILPFTLMAIIMMVYPSTIMAQTVAVTGTITDTQTTPYSNGLLTVTFVNSTGQLATFGGNPSFQKSYAIYLDANGAFTISLPPNSTASPSIQPAGTQWNFSYQSQGGYGAANINVTITGAGSISGTLSNLARITWPYGNIPPPGAAGQGIVFVSSTTLGWGSTGGGGGVPFAAGGGAAQAQTVSPTPAIVALTNGLQVCWLPIAANTAAAPTLSISGLAAKPITKYGTVALVANDITTVAIACAVYDGTEFQLQVPLAGGVYSGSLNLGSGASAAGATAMGGFACVEGASTGWTPTAGQTYLRCDNTLNNYAVSIPLNGATETPLPVFSAVPTGGKCTQTSGVAGLLAEIAGPCGTATISGLTTGVLSKAASATMIGDSLCDEGVTAANTLTCRDTAGLVTPKIGTGTTPPACAVATSAWCGLESVPPTAVAGVDDLWPDSTDHSWKAHSNGAGIELLSLVSPGPIHQTAKTAAIATATLCLAADCGQAGNYTVEWAFTQVGTACGTPGAGGVTFLLTWTDQNAVTHSAIQMPMDDAASLVATTGTFHFTTSNATAWGSGNMNISSNGAILQYATGYTACGVGTGSYQLDAWVTRKR